MVDLIPKNTGKFQASGIGDALIIGGIKVVEERALTSIIGNGTLKSGAIKLAGGAVLSGIIGGKAGNLAGSAFAIDGMEDIVNGILGVSTSSSSTTANADAW